jgi:acyl dehydratase
LTAPRVGDRFRHERSVDPLRPLFYAGAAGDWFPIHVDPKAAVAAGHASTILHGPCTLAWAVEAVTMYLGDPGAIRRMKTRFVAAVKPGDRISFEGEVTKIEGARLTARVSARNQDGAEVLKGTVVEAELR